MNTTTTNNRTGSTRGTWFVAKILRGLPGGGLATGQRVVFRLTVTGRVEVIGRGKVTAVLSMRAAKACLETVRTPDLLPTAAANQAGLSIRWDQQREARRFLNYPRRVA